MMTALQQKSMLPLMHLLLVRANREVENVSSFVLILLQIGDFPSCCGSSAVGPDSILQPSGAFVRSQVIFVL